jgi:hypothetical protein
MITPPRLLTGLLGTAIALTASCTMDLKGLPESAATSAAAASGGGSGSASSGGSGGAGGSTTSSASSTVSVSSSSSASSSGISSSASSSSSSSSSSGTGGAGPTTVVAGELLVNLDVNDATAGTASWINKGTLGGVFAKAGNPMKGMAGGKDAIVFSGGNDVYVGPKSTDTIEGTSDRTIELWVLKPAVDNNEQAMLSWSDRQGQTNGRMMSFNYCKTIASSAISHWGGPADLNWGSPGAAPPQNQWHHLVYTYDGTKAIVFADGMKMNEKTVTIDTRGGFSINLAAQRDGNGFDKYGTLSIAVARVHSKALTESEVNSNYDAEKSRFQ